MWLQQVCRWAKSRVLHHILCEQEVHQWTGSASVQRWFHEVLITAVISVWLCCLSRSEAALRLCAQTCGDGSPAHPDGPASSHPTAAPHPPTAARIHPTSGHTTGQQPTTQLQQRREWRRDHERASERETRARQPYAHTHTHTHTHTISTFSEKQAILGKLIENINGSWTIWGSWTIMSLWTIKTSCNFQNSKLCL